MSVEPTHDGRHLAAVIELTGTEERGVGAALRAALDCRVFDVVRVGPGLDMWIDEEGLLVGEPVVNRVATLIAKAHGFVWQRYVGAVVFNLGGRRGGDAEPA